MNLDLSFFIHIVPDKSRQISSKFKLRALSRLQSQADWRLLSKLKIEVSKFSENSEETKSKTFCLESWLRYVVKYILQTLLLSKLKESVTVSTNCKWKVKLKIAQNWVLASAVFQIRKFCQIKTDFFYLKYSWNCCRTNSVFTIFQKIIDLRIQFLCDVFALQKCA